MGRDRATGVLHHPVLPDIPGRDSFAGARVPLARAGTTRSIWRGKRVGVVGTGSTAAQIVGAIAKEVAHLSVFQRTPHWMVGLPQKEYSRALEGASCGGSRSRSGFLYYAYYVLMTRGIGGAVLGDPKAHRRIADACERNLARRRGSGAARAAHAELPGRPASA